MNADMALVHPVLPRMISDRVSVESMTWEEYTTSRNRAAVFSISAS